MLEIKSAVVVVCVGDWQIQIIFTQETVLRRKFRVPITSFAIYESLRKG